MQHIDLFREGKHIGLNRVDRRNRNQPISLPRDLAAPGCPSHWLKPVAPRHTPQYGLAVIDRLAK